MYVYNTTGYLTNTDFTLMKKVFEQSIIRYINKYL